MELVVITGMSGAGKTTALHVLEDMGYYCTDNIPPVLMPELASALMESKGTPHDKIAMVADMRMGQFFEGLSAAVDKVRAMGFTCRLLFLDASDESILNRYNLTKRKHPMAGSGSVLSGVAKERRALMPLRNCADIVIDTTSLNEKTIKEKVKAAFSDGKEDRGAVRIVTFGFKRGMPMDLDMVYDMRYLPNPYYDEALQDLNGSDPRVDGYIFRKEASERQVDAIADYILSIFKEYVKNSKDTLAVGIGCTGGKHRSVASGVRVAERLKAAGIDVALEHRDIDL